jgi:hypothetical protein
VAKNKSGGGGKKRKAGDWQNIANGRKGRGLEVINRANRDIPQMGDVGSAAYRRAQGKHK